MIRKKLVAVGIVGCMVLALAGCGNNSTSGSSGSSTASQAVTAETASAAGSEQAANPWKDFDSDSLEEAEEYSGVNVVLPTALDDYLVDSYRAMSGIIEGIYKTSDGQGLVVRKGTGDSEISGDYNDYAYSDSVESDEGEDDPNGPLNLVYRGDSEDSVRVATWSLQGMQYAIVVDSDSEGISIDDMSNYVTYLVETNEDVSDAGSTDSEEISDSQAAQEMIMQEIASDIQPGSSDSSEEVANMAAEALNWAAVTDLNEEEVKSISTNWKSLLSDDDLNAYNEAFPKVLAMATKAVDGDADAIALMTDGSEEDENSAESWDENALALVKAMQ